MTWSFVHLCNPFNQHQIPSYLQQTSNKIPTFKNPNPKIPPLVSHQKLSQLKPEHDEPRWTEPESNLSPAGPDPSVAKATQSTTQAPSLWKYLRREGEAVLLKRKRKEREKRQERKEKKKDKDFFKT